MPWFIIESFMVEVQVGDFLKIRAIAFTRGPAAPEIELFIAGVGLCLGLEAEAETFLLTLFCERIIIANCPASVW